MSFIPFYNSFFKSHKNESNKNIVGRLKNASSCTDTRACNLNPKSYRDFFMESISFASNSEETEENSYGASSRRSHSLQNVHQNDLIRLKSQLSSADNKIASLASLNKKLRLRNTLCSSEVVNLRVLIKDLQQQIVYLECLKTENTTLRSDGSIDFKAHCLKAEDEIHHLNSELQIYQDVKEKYEELKHAYERIKTEHIVLRKTFSIVNEEKAKLQVQCKLQKESLDEWKCEASNMSSVMGDKNLLSDKIQQKDDTIADLCESITMQEICIQDLNNQLEKVAREFEFKQKLLSELIEELKKEVNYKTSQATDVESRLAMSKIVVQELESLCEQFRSTNSDLIANVNVFKNQFMTVLNSSNSMVETIENLQKQLEEKSKYLEKSKQCPQNTKSKFYFMELNRLLNSPRLKAGIGDSVSLNDAVMSIKSILNCLKSDLWAVFDNSPTVVELKNSASEITVAKQDNCSQKPLQLCCSSAQTIGNDYYGKYNEALKKIEKITDHNTSLSLCNQTQKEISILLQKKIYITQKDMKINDTIVKELKHNSQGLYEYFIYLDEELNYSNNLLHKCVIQGEFESDIRALSHKQFEIMYSSIINEYEAYVQVLGFSLDRQKVLKESNTRFNNTLDIDQLKQEMSVLNVQLEKEKSKTSVLQDEFDSLSNMVKEKSLRLFYIEEKLESTEKLLDHFASGNQLESRFISDMENNEIGLKLKMVLNLYKYHLGNELEIRKRSSETFNKTQIQKYLKISNQQKAKLQKKLLQMNVGMKRAKNIKFYLTDKTNISDNLIKELSTVSEIITFENNCLKKTNLILLEEIGCLKIEMENIQINLTMAESSKKELLEVKSKMEKMIMGQMKKLAKYKKIIDKINMKNDECDELVKNIELLKAENYSLSLDINELQGSDKECKTVGTQVTIGKTQNDEINRLKEHYEAIIYTLTKEHSFALDQFKKQSAFNLKMLQETYEKENSALKKNHAEKYEELESLHENEIASIKEEFQLNKEKLNKEMLAREAKHQEEVDILKKEYQTLLAEKEKLFTSENEMLNKELGSIILEKDSQLDRISSELSINFQNFRNKCKLNVKKIKEKHKANLGKVVEVCKHEVIKVMEDEEKIKKIWDKQHRFDDHKTEERRFK